MAAAISSSVTPGNLLEDRQQIVGAHGAIRICSNRLRRAAFIAIASEFHSWASAPPQACGDVEPIIGGRRDVGVIVNVFVFEIDDGLMQTGE